MSRLKSISSFCEWCKNYFVKNIKCSAHTDLQLFQHCLLKMPLDCTGALVGAQMAVAFWTLLCSSVSVPSAGLWWFLRCWLFLAVLVFAAAEPLSSREWALSASVRRLLTVGEHGPSAWGFSSCGPRALQHRLRYSPARGIFPGQGSNPYLLYWQADSLPLS